MYGCSTIPAAPKVVEVPVQHKVATVRVAKKPHLAIQDVSPAERNPAVVIKALSVSICQLMGYSEELFEQLAPYAAIGTDSVSGSALSPCGRGPP